MLVFTAGLLLAALPVGLAKGDAKTVEVASMPGCTQFMTIDGATFPACAVETVTRDTTVTSLRHTGASGVAGPSGGSGPAFTYDPVWTNSTNTQATASTALNRTSSGLATQPAPLQTSSSKKHTSKPHEHSTVAGSFGPYINSTNSFTMSHASIASGAVGTAPHASSSISHAQTSKPETHSSVSSIPPADPASIFTKTVIVTATVTVDGTEVKTTSASLVEVSGKPSVSLPGVLSLVPAYGPEVTKATSQKSRQPAKPTPSCTLARNPHFGKCILKDVGSKAKANGTAALVTASGSPQIYKAICDCKRIPNVSNNHTMPVPVEVCGALMCPNEMPSKPEQPVRPPGPSGPGAGKSGFTTSPKPQVTGSSAAIGSSIETSSKHYSNSEKSSHAESIASHTGTVTGRVTVNVPVPTNAISSATEALKSSSSAKTKPDAVESIWDSLISKAGELGVSPTTGV